VLHPKDSFPFASKKTFGTSGIFHSKSKDQLLLETCAISVEELTLLAAQLFELLDEHNINVSCAYMLGETYPLFVTRNIPEVPPLLIAPFAHKRSQFRCTQKVLPDAWGGEVTAELPPMYTLAYVDANKHNVEAIGPNIAPEAADVLRSMQHRIWSSSGGPLYMYPNGCTKADSDLYESRILRTSHTPAGELFRLLELSNNVY